MSKYKFQKQFIFSTKKIEQIHIFLEVQRQIPLHLTSILDAKKNTILHQCAFKGEFKIMKVYWQYFIKNISKYQKAQAEKQHKEKRRKLSSKQKQIVNEYRQNNEIEQSNNDKKQIERKEVGQFLNCKNQEGFTACHYASYKGINECKFIGHIEILEFLMENGASIDLINNQGLNALHFAAQGDKAKSMLFLTNYFNHNEDDQEEILININCIDDKKSTPLHWASYTGSQKVVEFLLSQKTISINQQDFEGQTPLHLAAMYGNIKIVKKLLLAGANRTIKNVKLKTPKEIAQQNQFYKISEMIVPKKHSIVNNMKLYYNIKMEYEPKNRSYALVYIFFSLFLLVLGILEATISYQHDFLHYILILLYLITLIFYGLLIRPPSQRKRYSPSYLLEVDSVYQICFGCSRKKRKRQNHCEICHVCIQQYDHHCWWINNCVGKHNLPLFYSFICSIFVLICWLGYIGFSILIMFVKNSFNDPTFNSIFSIQSWILELNSDSIVKEIYPYLLLIICLIPFISLIIPLFILIVVQTRNLLLNKTTYERFSKNAQSILSKDQSSLFGKSQDSKQQSQKSNQKNNKKLALNKSMSSNSTNSSSLAYQMSLKNCKLMCCHEENLALIEEEQAKKEHLIKQKKLHRCNYEHRNKMEEEKGMKENSKSTTSSIFLLKNEQMPQ